MVLTDAAQALMEDVELLEEQQLVEQQRVRLEQLIRHLEEWLPPDPDVFEPVQVLSPQLRQSRVLYAVRMLTLLSAHMAQHLRQEELP